MTDSEKYFIYLLKCFLNDDIPEGKEHTDYNKIYKLAESQNVISIIANEVAKLKEEYQPLPPISTYFVQNMGFSVRNYTLRSAVCENIKKLLNENEIPHFFIKGAVTKEKYPVPELRTSGDIDLIVDEKYEKAYKVLKSNGFNEVLKNEDVVLFRFNNEEIELHKGIDDDRDIFDNPFSLCEKKGGYTYEMKPYYDLLYTVCHIVKHLKSFGAGIRMLMDVDVIIRSKDDFDLDCFENLAEKCNIKQTASAILSITKYYFDTPINAKIDFNDDENKDFADKLTSVFIEGGVFGFDNNSLGDVYVSKVIKNGKSVTAKDKLKAILLVIFPKANTLYMAMPIARKHKILLPVAWLKRVFTGVFKHGGHSLNTAKQIMNSKDSAVIKKEVLNELHIDE